ncbi:MAG: hypothetical protein HN341_19285 [Verrucomicrobia bacterium]|nr:hypothetical protein [Verrucomicrobiota bacterium]
MSPSALYRPGTLSLPLFFLCFRGWANYHRHVVSSEIFSYIDWEVTQML